MLLHNNISSGISPTAFFRDFTRRSFCNFSSSTFGCFRSSFWDFQEFLLGFLLILRLSRKSFCKSSRNPFLGLLYKNILRFLQKIFLKFLNTFYFLPLFFWNFSEISSWICFVLNSGFFFLKIFSKRNQKTLNTAERIPEKSSEETPEKISWGILEEFPWRIWGWPSWVIPKGIFEVILANFPG